MLEILLQMIMMMTMAMTENLPIMSSKWFPAEADQFSIFIVFFTKRLVRVMIVNDNNVAENPGRTSSSLCTLGLPTPIHSKPVEARIRKATTMAANHFSIKNLLLLSVLLQPSSGVVWQTSGLRLRGQCAVSNIFTKILIGIVIIVT